MYRLYSILSVLCFFVKYNIKIMKQIEEVAAKNQQKAREIITDTNLMGIWHDIGATINLVGSLKMGLFVKHRDIDFHIYTDKLNIIDSFYAVTKLAQNPRIKRIEYSNLIDTVEKCIEWHAWYEDDCKDLWQLDMIHIEKGSTYDGYFELVAERISAILTEETRHAILRLKYETPETEKIMGIVYYQAVIRDGVRTYTEFTQWLKDHPTDGIIEWMP